jgi:putative membrane protein
MVMTSEPADRKVSSEEFRLLLQLETTMLMWLRTSLALMGFGFVIARFGLFLREIAQAHQLAVEPPSWLVGVNSSLGTGLIVLGIVVMLLAVGNHRRAVERLRRGEFALPSSWSLSVILSLIVAAVGMGMAIYLALV